MLTPGNAKLGTDLIWGFGLPSGGIGCVGMTKTCRAVCYARRTEQYRPKAAERYRQNLTLTKTKGFVRRVRAFLIAHHVRVVRIHTGGEFYSVRYIRKWRAIIRRSPRVKFFTYTRAWQKPLFRAELEAIARENPHFQLWYSADRETGLPEHVPPMIRVAWLMTEKQVQPPETGRVDLIFRVHRLRSTPLSQTAGIPICPAEAGMPGPTPTCDHCGRCWKPACNPSLIRNPSTNKCPMPPSTLRIALPLVR